MITTSERSQAKKGLGTKQLVLFDFDGTITTKDTLEEFMIFYRGKTKYYLGLAALSPILGAYVLKLISNWKSKQFFLKWFLKGEDVSEFNQKCIEFTETKLDKLVRPAALEAIRKYQQSGATVAVVSASAINWVKPWCDKYGLICLATRLEIVNNKITGNFEGKNCHGAEKVCRIQEHFQLNDFNHIVAFGDSSGDTEMLALAHEKYYKPFRA